MDPGNNLVNATREPGLAKWAPIATTLRELRGVLLVYKVLLPLRSLGPGLRRQKKTPQGRDHPSERPLKTAAGGKIATHNHSSSPPRHRHSAIVAPSSSPHTHHRADACAAACAAQPSVRAWIWGFVARCVALTTYHHHRVPVTTRSSPHSHRRILVPTAAYQRLPLTHGSIIETAII